VVRYYAEVNEETLDSGIQGHHRADVVKSLETSSSFPTALLSLLLLLGDWPCCIAGLEYVNLPARVVTGGLGVTHSSFGFRSVHFNFGNRGQLAITGRG
jgi:hypothetical protein